MEVKVFSDLAEAFEKLVGAVEKLGGMVGSAVAGGIRIMDAYDARRTHARLRVLLVSSTYERVSLITQFTPTLDAFLDNPTETNWQRVKFVMGDAIKGLDDVADQLKLSSPAIASQEFFPAFVESVVARQAILKAIDAMSRPKSEEELKGVEELFFRYRRLLGKIAAANEAFSDYIDKRIGEAAGKS